MSVQQMDYVAVWGAPIDDKGFLCLLGYYAAGRDKWTEESQSGLLARFTACLLVGDWSYRLPYFYLATHLYTFSDLISLPLLELPHEPAHHVPPSIHETIVIEFLHITWYTRYLVAYIHTIKYMLYPQHTIHSRTYLPAWYILYLPPLSCDRVGLEL